MAATIRAEVIVMDDTGAHTKILMNMFLCADNNWRGAEEIPGGRTAQLIVAPFTASPTPKQKGDQLHLLRTNIAHTAQ